jgi:hypothetical protein
MAKKKRESNHLQNTTHKTKDRVTGNNSQFPFRLYYLCLSSLLATVIQISWLPDQIGKKASDIYIKLTCETRVMSSCLGTLTL